MKMAGYSANKYLKIMKTTKNDVFLNTIMTNISLYDVQEADLRMEVASILHRAMEDKGLSITDMSRIMGFKDSEVSLWLSGTIDIPTEVICGFEKVIGEELQLPEAMYA